MIKMKQISKHTVANIDLAHLFNFIKDSERPSMDDKEFRSIAFQRVFQYLRRYNDGESLDKFSYGQQSLETHLVEGTSAECLNLLLK